MPHTHLAARCHRAPACTSHSPRSTLALDVVRRINDALDFLAPFAAPQRAAWLAPCGACPGRTAPTCCSARTLKMAWLLYLGKFKSIPGITTAPSIAACCNSLQAAIVTLRSTINTLLPPKGAALGGCLGKRRLRFCGLVARPAPKSLPCLQGRFKDGATRLGKRCPIAGTCPSLSSPAYCYIFAGVIARGTAMLAMAGKRSTPANTLEQLARPAAAGHPLEAPSLAWAWVCQTWTPAHS
jgi:hypothetical protein